MQLNKLISLFLPPADLVQSWHDAALEPVVASVALVPERVEAAAEANQVHRRAVEAIVELAAGLLALVPVAAVPLAIGRLVPRQKV